MKKLLYLFLTVLMVACSGDDSNSDSGDNNNNTFSLVGTWNLTSILVNGVAQILDATCAYENFIELNDTSGTIYFHFNEDSEGPVPCFLSSTETFTYTNTPAGSNQYLLTTGDGFVLSGELNSNGTVLSIINEDDDVLNFTKQ